MVKVSIILLSYNHEKYLREAIDSSLNQTFKDFELIIWDDASTDDSWGIINGYSDDRIKLFRNEMSQRGVYGANKAITEVAKGKYIAIHHSDDVWKPTKLEKQVEYLEAHTEIGAVFTNALAINEESNPLEDSNHFYYSIFDQPNRTRYEWLNFFFYHGNALCHPSILIRKKCYDTCGLYRYGLAQLGDYDMWVRLCLKYEIHVLPEKLTKFRVRDNEANSSGVTPTTRIRTINEHYFIAKNFLQLTEWNDLVKVFPNAQQYYRAGGSVVEFVFAMMALDDKAWQDVKLFGLTLLYELMNDKEKSSKIKEYYGFDYLDLIKLSSTCDVFSIDALHQLYNPEQNIQLFLDHGNGFSEENSIKLPVAQSTDIQEFVFDLSDKPTLTNLRLDPLNDNCVIEIEKCTLITDQGEIDLLDQITSNTLIRHGKSCFFDSYDPIIYFEGLSTEELAGAVQVVATIRYAHIAKNALEACINQTKTELEQTKTELEQTKTELEQTKTELEQTKTELEQTKATISRRITKPLRKIKQILKGN